MLKSDFDYFANFYKDRNVLITGHTGFKGTWMCKMLLGFGANVLGYALEPPTEPSLFNLCGLNESVNNTVTSNEGGTLRTVIGDVRDLPKLEKTFKEFKPEVVIHMAAQPIVRTSYIDPVGTYEINVMGTVNILECVRNCNSVISFVNVTTDKVYLNKEWNWGYRENEELNGYDPYSNSKSCSELVTSSYVNSFFNEEIKKGRKIAISTMRAGNVIGGGDFAKDRIVPDIVRALENRQCIEIRNSHSVRPYQHVLEPVFAYLMVAAKQYNDISLASSYNIGPDEKDAWDTGRLVRDFKSIWDNSKERINNFGELGYSCLDADSNAPHEANYLKLDCSKIKSVFDWNPAWNVEKAIEKIVEWTEEYLICKASDDISKEQIISRINTSIDGQISDYCHDMFASIEEGNRLIL